MAGSTAGHGSKVEETVPRSWDAARTPHEGEKSPAALEIVESLDSRRFLVALLVAWVTGLTQIIGSSLSCGGSVAVTVLPIPVGVAEIPASAAESGTSSKYLGGADLTISRADESAFYEAVAFPAIIDPRALPESNFGDWPAAHGGFPPFVNSVRLIIEGKSGKRTVIACRDCVDSPAVPRKFVLNLDDAQPQLAGVRSASRGRAFPSTCRTPTRR